MDQKGLIPIPVLITLFVVVIVAAFFGGLSWGSGKVFYFGVAIGVVVTIGIISSPSLISLYKNIKKEIKK